MKHLVKLLAAAGVVALALADCGGGGGTATSQSGEAKDAISSKACAVSDAGGQDDKSFNEPTYEGLKASQTSLGIQISTAEFNSDADSNPNIESMVSDGCNLIIGVGFNPEEAVHTSADEDKDVHHALIDSSFNGGNNNTVTLDNARLLLFNTAETAHLAGYMVMGMTKTDRVATFGGIQTPSVTVLMDSFADGVTAYNKAKSTNVQLLGWDKTTQNGSFIQSFDDQMFGKEQAQQFISQGVDIIIPVAGPVDLGAVVVAKADRNTWIIGADPDWYEVSSDYSPIVLTSVMKEIGASIGQAIQDSVNGKFNSTSYMGTLANGDVSTAPFHDFDDKVSVELKADLTKPTDDIKSGKLVIRSQGAPK